MNARCFSECPALDALLIIAGRNAEGNAVVNRAEDLNGVRLTLKVVGTGWSGGYVHYSRGCIVIVVIVVVVYDWSLLAHCYLCI